MDESLRQLIFEVCNDWMCARLPMTEAMHSAFMESTGDRGKYPNALDTLARIALGCGQLDETPNGEVRGASPEGEASSGEAATSTVVLGARRPREDGNA